jgi:hypothetical protein
MYTWKCHKETPCVASLKKQKCHIFFSCTISENRRAEEVLPGWGVVLEGKGGGKCWRVNMEQILYTHVYKWKSDICELSRNGGRGDEGKWWRG